jgi:hypothetical protein
VKFLSGILGASLAVTSLAVIIVAPAVAQDEGLQLPETTDLDLTSGDDAQEPGYLYFRQAEPIDAAIGENFTAFENSITSFTPRAATDSSLFGMPSVAVDRFLFQGFTPRFGDDQISLRFGTDNNETGDDGISLSLSSNVRVEQADMPGVVNNPSLSQALGRQVYNFGVSLGYAGFNVGANYRGDRGALLQSRSGVDFGISYSGESWSTSLLVGEYTRRYQNIYTDDERNRTNFYALEWGASYQLTRSLSFSGGFRYLTLGRQGAQGLSGLDQAQEFYLGTSLNF